MIYIDECYVEGQQQKQKKHQEEQQDDDLNEYYDCQVYFYNNNHDHQSKEVKEQEVPSFTSKVFIRPNYTHYGDLERSIANELGVPDLETSEVDIKIYYKDSNGTRVQLDMTQSIRLDDQSLKIPCTQNLIVFVLEKDNQKNNISKEISNIIEWILIHAIPNQLKEGQQLLSQFGWRLLFESRDDAMEIMRLSINKRWNKIKEKEKENQMLVDNNNNDDKKNSKMVESPILENEIIDESSSSSSSSSSASILIVSGSPGIGKTRFLLEYPKKLREIQDESITQDWIDARVTFGNDTMVSEFDKLVGIETALSLRIIHNMLKLSIPLHELVMKWNISKHCTLSLYTALLVVRTYLFRPPIPTDQVVAFYLSIDDYHRLLSSNDPDGPKYLEQLVKCVGDAMNNSPPGVFFVAVMGGTVTTPLLQAAQKMGHKCQQIPLNTLPMHSVMSIARSQPICNKFITSRGFQAILFCLGGLPRALEYVMEEMESSRHNTFTEVIRAVRDRLERTCKFVNSLALVLLLAAQSIAGIPVADWATNRPSPIYPTYEALEQSGLITKFHVNRARVTEQPVYTTSIALMHLLELGQFQNDTSIQELDMVRTFVHLIEKNVAWEIVFTSYMEMKFTMFQYLAYTQVSISEFFSPHSIISSEQLAPLDTIFVDLYQDERVVLDNNSGSDTDDDDDDNDEDSDDNNNYYDNYSDDDDDDDEDDDLEYDYDGQYTPSSSYKGRSYTRSYKEKDQHHQNRNQNRNQQQQKQKKNNNQNQNRNNNNQNNQNRQVTTMLTGKKVRVKKFIETGNKDNDMDWVQVIHHSTQTSFILCGNSTIDKKYVPMKQPQQQNNNNNNKQPPPLPPLLRITKRMVNEEWKKISARINSHNSQPNSKKFQLIYVISSVLPFVDDSQSTPIPPQTILIDPTSAFYGPFSSLPFLFSSR